LCTPYANKGFVSFIFVYSIFNETIAQVGQSNDTIGNHEFKRMWKEAGMA
jgi:hypothetical protein